MTQYYLLSCGGLFVRIQTEVPIKLPSVYREFEVESKVEFQTVDLDIQIVRSISNVDSFKTQSHDMQLLLDSKQTWALSELTSGQYLFHPSSVAKCHPLPPRVLCSSDFSSMTIEIMNKLDPIIMLPELLFLHRLVHLNGAIFHASAFTLGHSDSNSAFDNTTLFLADSGTGKSTCAEFTKTYFGPNASILSDDRVVIRFGDRPEIFGTPWHGSFPAYSKLSAYPKNFLFLRQSQSNKLRRLSSAEAFERLVPVTFCPFWIPGLFNDTLVHLKNLSKNINLRFFEFSFENNLNSIHFLQQYLFDGHKNDQSALQ